MLLLAQGDVGQGLVLADCLLGLLFEFSLNFDQELVEVADPFDYLLALLPVLPVDQACLLGVLVHMRQGLTLGVL